MIEVELPDGRVVEINTTDTAVAAQAAQKFLSGNAQAAPQTGMLEDAAKSVGAGLANATAGTLGMAGDVRSLLSAGTDYLGGKMGAAPDRVQAFKDIMSKAASMTGPGMAFANAPTSRQIKDSAPNPIVSPDYEPKTAMGGVLKTGAEFLPAMAGGPESLATKFLTRVAAPALVSEGAGALTKGTDAEPYARIGGALLAGSGASKIANTMAGSRAVQAATPALADVKAASTNTYDALTSRNVATPIPQAALDNLASDITTTLNNKGIRPSNASSIHQAISEINVPATAGAADVADLVAARQSIKQLLGKPDTNKTGAVLSLQKIEKAIEQNSPGTMAKLKEADKNYAAVKANEALDKKLARAELRASGENSGLNTGNRIRQNVANYLLSNEAKYLSAENKKTLESVVKGTATQNAIRFASNLLGGGGGVGSVVLGLGGAAAGQYSGHPELALLPVAGIGLRLGANRLTGQQAKRAAETIRARSPLGQQNPPLLPQTTNPMLSGLLSALLARPQQ